MSEQFTPRTVVVVALASLVAGFVTVFGGGMLALRPRTRPEVAAESPVATPPSSDVREQAEAGAEADPDGEAPPEESDAAAPPEAAGVTITPLAISRCFDGMAPIPIAGERCGRLPELDAHFTAHAAQIAACASGGHGRLAFVMDFRFSNQHVGAWGGPASTVANAGPVSLCVRRATAPLPLATIAHAHDRYIATVAIEWQ